MTQRKFLPHLFPRGCTLILLTSLLLFTESASLASTSMAASEEALPVVEVKFVETDPLTTLMESEISEAPSKAATAVELEKNPLVEGKREDLISLAQMLADKFKQPIDVILKVVAEIDVRVYKDFPTRRDILAIIGVESSFNPKAKYRGSYGLMQVNNPVHGSNFTRKPGETILDIGPNVGIGVSILRQYYESLGSKKAAVLAYNAGIGNYLKGRSNLDYWRKFTKQKSALE